MPGSRAFTLQLLLALVAFSFVAYPADQAAARGVITVEIQGYSGPGLVDIRGPRIRGQVFRRSIKKTGRTVLRRAPLGRYLVRAREVSLGDRRAVPLRVNTSFNISKKRNKRRVVIRYRTIFIARKISAGREHTCALRPSRKRACRPVCRKIRLI